MLGARFTYNQMQTFRWILAAAIFLALLLLSLQNAEQVTLRFFNLANLQAPLVFVVFLAFAGGVACGLLAGAFRAARLKRQLNALRREYSGSETTRSPLSGGTLTGNTPLSPRFPPGERNGDVL